jgi:hypothetical protein
MHRIAVKLLPPLICIAPVACGPTGPPIEVDTAELVGAYISNAPAADARFGGHPLIVTGISGGVDISNRLTLFPGVIADIRGDATSVAWGASVTIKCDSVNAKAHEVYLTGCAVKETHTITLEEAAARTQAIYDESRSKQSQTLLHSLQN